MKKFVLLALLLTSPSFARQQTASDRIGARLGSMMIAIEEPADTITTQQATIERQAAEIKVLKDKHEPKPKD